MSDTFTDAGSAWSNLTATGYDKYLEYQLRSEPIFDQFVQEVPIDILDVPRAELPQTREDMKGLMDKRSRWLNLQGDAG